MSEKLPPKIHDELTLAIQLNRRVRIICPNRPMAEKAAYWRGKLMRQIGRHLVLSPIEIGYLPAPSAGDEFVILRDGQPEERVPFSG